MLINAFVTLLIVAPPLYFAAVTLWSADATDRWRQENHALWAELQARCANENDGTEKSHEFPYDSESQYSACMIEGNALNRARNPKPL
ncbi:MAG: hypothetical protein JNM20_19725 [Rhizobiales bacterium]|nr:hypothetical protein [Hyphomicrobiales bacterium]